MNRNDLPVFSCLSCEGDLSLKVFVMAREEVDNIKEGMLFCDLCRSMYPIRDGIPLLLASGYAGYFDVREFSCRWAEKFDFNRHEFPKSGLNEAKIKQLDFYNEDSESYDDLVSQSNFWRASDWNTIGRWINELPQNGILLDMGCGTGRCTIPIAKSGRRVIGTDISIGMLRKAMLKSEESGLSNITYFLSDAENLPVKRGVFSAAISFGLLHHVDDPAKVIGGVERLLKSRGVFYALENSDSFLRPVFNIFMKMWKLWNEEAGSHSIFKINEIKSLIEATGMCPDIRTSTYLPPHLFNLMGYTLAKKVLYTTDRFFGYIPGVRNIGGQLVIKASKK